MSWTPTTEHKRFIRLYGDALSNRDAALFVGAGVSMAAGYVDWKALLRGIAEDLGLDVDRESDLVALTQFHVNKRGSRAHINQVLIDELTRGATLTPIHEVVARLPIDTVWTTNYDTLIERSFEDAGKSVDTKRTIPNLAQIRRGKDVTLYKMHGCVTQPEDAVLTKDDYENYDSKRALFSDSLKGDLIEKTFLFLGFSFTDPNIDQILSRVRTLLGVNQREHFCVMRRPPRPAKLKGKHKADFEYERQKAEHQSADLKRFGIQTLWIEEYIHLEPLLRALAAYVDRSSVFVAGAAQDSSPIGADRLQRLSRGLGERLVRDGYRLVTGFGLGIGEQVALGALHAQYFESLGNHADRVLIRPFPRASNPAMQSSANARHREDLISRVGAVVVIAGNKADGPGAVRLSEGVMQEVGIAKRLGKFIIPVGVTGHVARQVWNEAVSNPQMFLPNLQVDRELHKLGDDSASDADVLDAVFVILSAAERASAMKQSQ